jgi:serine/threonine protein phosphatase PrpC
MWFEPYSGLRLSLSAVATGSDRTDPLMAGGGFDERVTPLWASPGGELEQVEVWGPSGRSDAFLRYSVADDSPRTAALRDLLLNLPEGQTGFRDLVIRDGYSLAASFTLPDECLSNLAPGSAGPSGILRLRDLLTGMAHLAHMLQQAQEQHGLGWAQPASAQVGLRRVQAYAPAGHVQWQWQFTGWDALALDTPTDTRSLAALLLPSLRWRSEQAEQAALWCKAEVQRITVEVEGLAGTDGLTLGDLQAALLALLPQCLKLHGATDVGQRRNHNEDAYLLLEQEQRSAYGSRLTLAAVADGMGGHASGEVASSLALDLLRMQLIQLALPPRSRTVRADGLADDLAVAIGGAGRALLERAALDSAQAGMGTTMVGLATLQPQSTMPDGVHDDGLSCIFNIGDSRAYLLGAHGIARLSTDHSFVQELVDSGQLDAAEAFTHPQKNVITRCLGGGGGGNPVPDIFLFDPGPAELVLLCSDGLSDALRDEEIAAVVQSIAAKADGGCDLPALADALIAAANDAGGPDNITVILALARP